MKNISKIDNFIWPNKYLLIFLGFWPMGLDISWASRLFAYFRMMFSIFVVCTLFIPQVLMIAVCWGDISILTGVGCIAISVGQLLFKLLYMGVYHRKFCHILQRTKELWLISSNKEERENLEKLPLLAKQITIVFFILAISNIFSYTAASVIVWVKNFLKANDTFYPRNLPFDIWYGINTQRSPNFEIIFCSQAIAMVYGASGVTGFDTSMMSLILHICGQFKLVCVRFRAIGSRMHKEASLNINRENRLILEIHGSMKQHQRAIRLAEEMNELMSPVIFVQLMTSGLEICLSGYVLMMGINKSDRTEIIKGSFYIMTIFGQLLIWCWPGQLLIQESSAISDIICYELPWYMMTAKRQHEINFVILRSQKECKVTALGFQVMSLHKLTEVFNTAASYFALLRSMNEE